MENKGFILTGSAMIRMLGDIYRSKDEVINDLDFIMSYQDFKNLDIDLAKMTDKELSQVPESEYVKKLSDVMSEKLGKEYIIKKAFVGPDHGFVAAGFLGELFKPSGDFGFHLGLGIADRFEPTENPHGRESRGP